VESSVLHPSPLNSYFYVQEEKLGSTKNLVENYLLFLCITNQICASRAQAGGAFLRQLKKIPPAHVQQVCSFLSLLHKKEMIRGTHLPWPDVVLPG
jgi:hypothetical protein